MTGLLATLSPHGLGDWCPGLVRKPEPRHESWNIKWAEELAREVREADAGEVISHSYIMKLTFARLFSMSSLCVDLTFERQ